MDNNREGKALSASERLDMVHEAFYAAYGNQPDGPGTYIVDVYEDVVIVRVYPLYYRVAYSLEEGSVMFAPRAEWQRVEKEWLAAKGITDSETLIYFGDTVKSLGDGRVGGYLVRFGAPDDTDLEREFFDKSTDFDIENGAVRSVYYHHGMDPAIKTRKIGRGTLKIDDVGVWIEAQLSMRDRYEEAIYHMTEQGKVGWSSGTAAHLMQREPAGKASRITQWPLVEASLTPTPAELRNVAVPLKSVAMQDFKSLITDDAPEQGNPEATTPEAVTQTAAGNAGQPEKAVAADEMNAVAPAAEQAAINETDGAAKHAPVVEVMDMEEVKDQVQEAQEVDPTKALSDRLAAMEEKFGKSLDGLLDKIENSPVLKSAGYFTEDGGAADKQVKSFGDWLLSVRRGDTKRLTTVYKSATTKDMGEESGAVGGYLVPEEFLPRLLEAMGDNAVVRPRAEVIPVGSDAGKVPALDQFTAPTAGVGHSAFAGGVTADIAAAGSEGGTLTETTPGFDKVEWHIHKIGDYVEVDSELIADSPIAIEALLSRLFGRAVAAKEDYFFLRGTGVGGPLGILNAPAAISVDPDSAGTFDDDDALEMISRFHANTNRVFWLMHPSMIPDLANFEVGTGGSVYLSDQTVRPGSLPLFGYPILFSEHLPQADQSGCVILADLGSYMIFDRQNLAIAYSEHANFKTDQGVWRYTKRFDGKPWQKNSITLGDPQGSYTVSPFVFFND